MPLIPRPPEPPPDWPPPLDAASAACLNRTRAVVLNIIIVAGLLLVLSGFAVREFDFGIPPIGQQEGARRAAYATLIGVVVASYATRRALGGRSALRDPATRGPRYCLAHVAGAMIGAMAVPLGFAYGILVRPDIQEIALFWVAGMALGFLSLPRGHELADFDEPMINPARRPQP